MSYIIVWRNNFKGAFLDKDSSEFLEKYSSYEKAKEEAEKIQMNENFPTMSRWYFNYQIYKEVNS